MRKFLVLILIYVRTIKKDAILAHPMLKRIEMTQGSSIEKSIADQIKQRAKSAKKVMVCLDNNHAHEHKTIRTACFIEQLYHRV